MRRSSIAAVSLALLAGAPAHAADLYGSMKDDVYGEPEMARFYLRGDIGYSLTNDPDVTEEGIGLDNTELEDTWHAGGGIGVYFNSSWRADVTGDYYFDANIDGIHPGGGDFGAGNRDIDVNAAVALVNLYYEPTGAVPSRLTSAAASASPASRR